MVRSAQICKNCTILGNLRTITQERKKGTWKMIPFFPSTFWVLTTFDIHFCIWKMSIFFSLDSHFGPFWSSKFLYFEGEICVLSCLIQEMYTLRKRKNQVLLLENQICLISWSILPSPVFIPKVNEKYSIRVLVKVWVLHHHLDITNTLWSH